MGKVKFGEGDSLVRRIVFAGVSPLKAISSLTDEEHRAAVHARPGEEIPKTSFARSIQVAAALSFDEEVRLLLDPDTSDRDKLTISGRMMDRAGFSPTQKKQVTLKVEIAPTTIELLEKGLIEVKSASFLESGTRNLELVNSEHASRDAGGVSHG